LAVCAKLCLGSLWFISSAMVLRGAATWPAEKLCHAAIRLPLHLGCSEGRATVACHHKGKSLTQLIEPLLKGACRAPQHNQQQK
jgi:hypothetical protein